MVPHQRGVVIDAGDQDVRPGNSDRGIVVLQGKVYGRKEATRNEVLVQ